MNDDQEGQFRGLIADLEELIEDSGYVIPASWIEALVANYKKRSEVRLVYLPDADTQAEDPRRALDQVKSVAALQARTNQMFQSYANTISSLENRIENLEKRVSR